MSELISRIIWFIKIKHEYWDRNPKTGKERKLHFLNPRSLKGRFHIAFNIGQKPIDGIM